MIELGADIYHGHSAHICQGIEIHQGKPILYDTGNFIDDYAVHPLLRNDRSCLFRLVFEEAQAAPDRTAAGVAECGAGRAGARPGIRRDQRAHADAVCRIRHRADTQ